MTFLFGELVDGPVTVPARDLTPGDRLADCSIVTGESVTFPMVNRCVNADLDAVELGFTGTLEDFVLPGWFPVRVLRSDR